MVTSIALCTSMGVAALIGSRGIAIGVLLGWQLAATPLLLNISQLGVTREAILTSATTRVSPFSGPSGPGQDVASAPARIPACGHRRPPCVNPDPPRRGRLAHGHA